MAAKYRLRLGDREVDVEIEDGADGARAEIDGAWHVVSVEQIGDSAQYSLILDGTPFQLFAEQTPHGYQIVIGGRAYTVITNRAAARTSASGSSDLPATQTDAGEWVLASPMAGVVQKILVSPDDFVEADSVLMIIEAMKMQNELRARHGGQVKAVYVTVGQQVDQGTPLLVLL